MRIRLTELKRIIRSEVRRALHEDLSADFVGAPPPAKKPTPEEIADAQDAVMKLIDDSLKDRTFQATLGLPPPEVDPAAGLADSKEYYYNNILKKALRESSVDAATSLLTAAGIAAAAQALGAPPEVVLILASMTAAAAGLLARKIAKKSEYSMAALSAAADKLPPAPGA